MCIPLNCAANIKSLSLESGCKATPSGYSDPFWGFCEHRNALYDLFQKDGLYTDPYQGPGVCAAFCSPYESSPGYVGLSTKIIDGACACNFDDGSMPFPVPDGATEISDRLTVGPVTDGNLQNGVDCYPFLVSYIIYHSQYQIFFL